MDKLMELSNGIQIIYFNDGVYFAVVQNGVTIIEGKRNTESEALDFLANVCNAIHNGFRNVEVVE